MDSPVKEDDLRFHENLEGRIQNLAMAPSYPNTLIPVFEAIMNSLQGIQDRFGDEWTRLGHIRIEIHSDKNGDPNSFTITDNGIGLDDDNYRSFRTYDSRRKSTRGGKGVGRLTWLKVFESAFVESSFDDFTEKKTRQFEFFLHNERPIRNYELKSSVDQASVKTTITLRNLKSLYRAYCPKKLETLAQRISAHFLPFLVGDNCPEIVVVNDTQKIDLRDFISQNTFNAQKATFDTETVKDFSLRSVFISKNLIENPNHTIWLSAHDRLVNNNEINNQTGLDSSIWFEGHQVFYIGIVSSSYLDDNVTQERNNFDVPIDVLKAIREAALEKAKEYLKKQIDGVVEAKAKTIEKVVSKFPRYSYLVSDKLEMAKKLPLNRKTEEDVYREMSVYDYRETRNLVNAVALAVVTKPANEADPEIKDGLENLMKRVGDQERASLAEYVGKRKLVIDLLDSRLGYKDPVKENNHPEEAIHKIICPMRVNSQMIEYGQHNLWLLDDRLAYYDFWASDEHIKKYAKDSASMERPDLILFQGSTLLRRPGTAQPVVIVEFKKPAREDYDDEENPITQVYGYIRELRSKTIKDKDGKLITEIDNQTPFFCYLVCDVTPKLISQLEEYDVFQRLPGGRGYFGYNKNLKAYMEVLEYAELVKDARLRHEPFFKELGIN